MITCERCTEPATHQVDLSSPSSGRVLMSNKLCDQHTQMERTLRDTGLSIALVTVERLPAP